MYEFVGYGGRGVDDVFDVVFVVELGILEDVMEGFLVVEKKVMFMVFGMFEDIVIIMLVVDVFIRELVEDIFVVEEFMSEDELILLDDIEEDGSRELFGMMFKVLNLVFVMLKEMLELDSMLFVGREEFDIEMVEFGRSEEVCGLDEFSDGSDEFGRREDVIVVDKIVFDECVEEIIIFDVEEIIELVVDVVVVCCIINWILVINLGVEI